MKPINQYIDHTLLKPEATAHDIEILCKEAIEYSFYAVCVNSCYVALAKELLKDSTVKVASVVGFPLGAMSTEAKVYETENAIQNGAGEIDMVINIGWLKAHEYNLVQGDIKEVVTKAHSKKAIVKVIIETCLLSEDEIKKVCTLAVEAGADFVKTSTGFSTGGAKVSDIKLMKSVVQDKAKIKASGGIRDYVSAKAMIEAGADRIGASASINIVEESL